MSQSSLALTVQRFKNMFRTRPDATSVAYHYIPTLQSLVLVPPQCIPAHYNVCCTGAEADAKNVEGRHHSEKQQSMDCPRGVRTQKSQELRMCISCHELKRPSRMPLHFCLQAMCRIVWQVLPFSAYLTFEVDTSRCQFTTVIDLRLFSVQDVD